MIERLAALHARITLERPVRAGDELGGAVLSWSGEGDVWASIAATGAGRSAAYDSAPTLASYRLVINRRDDVRPGWRAIWNARPLRIVGVRDDGGPRIELDCEEEML